jgi:hypothetical protein
MKCFNWFSVYPGTGSEGDDRVTLAAQSSSMYPCHDAYQLCLYQTHYCDVIHTSVIAKLSIRFPAELLQLPYSLAKPMRLSIASVACDKSASRTSTSVHSL